MILGGALLLKMSTSKRLALISLTASMTPALAGDVKFLRDGAISDLLPSSRAVQ